MTDASPEIAPPARRPAAPSPFAALRPERADALAAGLILAAFALIRVAAYGEGLAVDPAVVDALWQNLTLAELDADLPGALLGLHSQPPLWNLVLGLFVKACGPDNLCVSRGLLALHMALTPVVAGLIWGTLRLAGAARGIAWGAAALFALSPGPLFYETFALYAQICCALATGGAFALAAFARGAGGGAVAALAISALLCLTWPLFHPAWIGVTFAALVLVDRRRALRPVPLVAFAAALALALAPSVWNFHRHGLFSNGSWMGMNLSQTVSWLSPEQRDRCLFRGAIADVEAAHREGRLPGPAAERDKSVHDPAIIARSRECVAMAADEILSRPGRWLLDRGAALVASHRLWSWEYPNYAPLGWERMPIPDVSRTPPPEAQGAEGWGLLALFLAIAALGLGGLACGLFGRRRGLAMALTLQVAAFTAASHVANGVEQNRMRHTIAPEWLMVAALGVDGLRRRRKARRGVD
ncbi:hypothetical protein [Albimonas pacifica]|uniref:Dolichyl-phosphate-mannose-protein mannosyltransferase n=1 Tax=Albimonas pacifica TaxID=1114924 RepID=A0A1I3EG53_9RHOB|nr:hypothetical protein [Albimonas pacifica]SFH97975.1 hypothetical protein SAMN05216258_103360 [Albimonas pacifica]